MADEIKIGAYVCKGCGLGERLNTGQLATTATRDGKAKFARSHDFLCSADGVAMIQKDIDSGETNHVVIAACSRRAKAEAFAFKNVTISRANLREGVIWVRPDTAEAKETTQDMADDYVRMACAESKFQKQPAASGEQTLCKDILVVGGGISGMTAALEAAKAANGGPIKRKDGKEVKSVVFVQCAGQRSTKPGHLSYCSGFCCTASIKQAMYFKDANPNVDTVVMYTDLRTPGAGGEDFYRSGQNKGVIFTKGVVNNVAPNGDDLTVNFKDLMLDEEISMPADLVVLATGQLPNSGPDPYAVPMEADKNDAEAVAASKAAHEVAVSVESILNLNYRQGTDLPHLKHGFTDSHFICFPYETRRTGIYSAGPVRRPMDSLQATIDATGAAMKAILEAENAGKGMAAHPRSGDLSFPAFRKEGCTQCKRCTVECPFGAINEDERGYPQFNESRCRRCGTCMGACPVRVISFENYSVDTVGSQIKGVDMPDEFSEKPRILVLACENDAYPALDMAAQNKLEYSAFARVVPVRCLGSVNTIWLTDALNSGYDGVVLMGCQKGDDYQCHFVKGSEIAGVRMSKIGDTLKTLNLEEARVATYEVAITDVDRVPKLINDMAETVAKVGMSPFKF